MEGSNAADGVDYSLISRRNASLSRLGCRLAFAALGLVIVTISLGFSLLGAWPILPFAGLELLVLYLALRYIERHAEDCERITIVGDKLLVELREVGRVRRHEFNRHWAQVIVRDEPSGCKLALRSHGHEVEVGQYLTCDERIIIGQQLKERLRRSSQWPSAQP